MTDRQEMRPGVPGWVKIVLALSLALNLLVVGIVAGVWWRGAPHDHPRLAGARGGMALIAALDRAERRDIFRELRRSGGLDRSGARLDAAEVLAALRAEPPQIDRLGALIDAQSARGQARQVRMRDALLARIGEMSAEDRRRYADRLEEIWSDMARRRTRP